MGTVDRADDGDLPCISIAEVHNKLNMVKSIKVNSFSDVSDKFDAMADLIVVPYDLENTTRVRLNGHVKINRVQFAIVTAAIASVVAALLYVASCVFHA